MTMKLSDYAVSYQHNEALDTASLEAHAALVKSLNDQILKAAREKLKIDDELRQGSVTSLAVTEIALERLSRLGKTYNCTMTIEAEAALERAKALDGWRRKGGALGPLHGVPLAHKDLFYRAGRKVTLGSPIHKDVVAKTTATVLRRLDDAGAVDAGSLQLSEFAYSATATPGTSITFRVALRAAPRPRSLAVWFMARSVPIPAARHAIRLRSAVSRG
jgi:hypothetical protein